MDTEDVLLKEIFQLYGAGEYTQVVLFVANNFPDLSCAPSEILEKLAWSYFNQARYESAMEIIKLSEGFGHELPSVRSHIGDCILNKIDIAFEVFDFGGVNDPYICNAFIVSARSQTDPSIYIGQALSCILRNKNADNIFAVHMLYNMGRLYFESSDPEAAIDYFGRAYARYGEKNFQYRADLMFWVAKAYQELGDIEAAIEAIEKCQELWREAIDTDPANKVFLSNLSNADYVCLELIELQSELMHLKMP
ncbi:tetratricopeptide repeat protein [bacterium]|nr:tetratricopeptide repeat protein [bacterium]